jgi:hypothetical protein
VTVIDLRELPSDEFVLHFGGRPHEVDAFTFSSSLLALSDALREINTQINPDFRIEITIEGLGPGSFRAKLKTGIKSLGGLFKHDARSLIVGILGSIIYTKYIHSHVDPSLPPTIVVNGEYAVVQHGSDRVIIPRLVWDAQRGMPKPQEVEKHVAKLFSVLDEDPSISEFGLARTMTDEPIENIPRQNFQHLANVALEPDGDDSRRYRDERALLVVLKAVFERGERRWQFVWGGIRISAPIKCSDFFDKLASREYQFAQGDVLDVTLRIFQTRDEMTGVFINEKYEVVRVHGLQHSPRQSRLNLPS